jgi:2-oxoglutarate ferredoxin oxidoreductase subunit alpha
LKALFVQVKMVHPLDGELIKKENKGKNKNSRRK